MKDDGVHENFFTVPELPYKKMEREAILLLKSFICARDDALFLKDFDEKITELFTENKDLVDWVMKYKGE